jgi:hypothetical protein
MQFRLLSILIAITLLSVLCAVIFAMPGFISVPMLTLILWISPSLWITGAIYARGRKQAFFIGGLAAGAVPFVVSALYSATVAAAAVIEADYDELWNPNRNDDRSAVIFLCLWLLVPGVCSVCGGVLGIFMHWRNAPRPAP